MIFHNFVYLASATILVLCGCVAYFWYNLETLNTNTRSFVVQVEEWKLQQVRAVETQLEVGNYLEAQIELKKIRARSLVRLAGTINRQFNFGTPLKAYALRVICAEMPIEPLGGDDPHWAQDARIIMGTATLCEANRDSALSEGNR